jgi:hypothetical protein
MNMKFYLLLTVLILSCFSAGVCFGQIYKYQDADGNWHFTDSPERVPQNAQTVKGIIRTESRVSDLKKQLYDTFSPRTPLEEATLGTVTIKTPLGLGSGFFITEDGYIVTNKHLIRHDERMKEKAGSHYEKFDKMAEQISQKLKAEEDRLKAFHESLAILKKLSEAERNPSTRTLLEDKYKADRETLSRMDQDFEDRKKDFLGKKETYEKEKSDYFWKTYRADRTLNFTIVLKDNSEQNAHLAAVSQNNDLALLKVDGCKTPFLKPGRLAQLSQGEKVYAIGSPAGLQDSVSAGVISGYDGYYLRTDAKIYPGNSGGPLVNQRGEVIGVNTLKEITHKFEGLGFAITMDIAIREFSHLIRRE